LRNHAILPHQRNTVEGDDACLLSTPHHFAAV